MIYVQNSYRTPVGLKNGLLKEKTAAELAAPVIQKLYSGLTNMPDEVILGNVTGPGGNIARLALLTAGLPQTIPGMTIDRQCSSGLEAIRLGAALIQAGQANVVIAGGCESSSTSPRPEKAVFSPVSIGDPDMGKAAEALAAKENISRKAQDAFACVSYRRFYESVKSGAFHQEIVPIGMTAADEAGLKKRPIEKMAARANAVFQLGGSVTAVNSSQMNDAACAVVLTKEKGTGLKLIGSAVAAGDPNFPAATPVPAILKLLKQTGLAAENIDRWEINEAFAVKILYTAQKLRIPIEKINPEGGGLALGHPYGASGAMLVNRLFYGMKKQQARLGIAAVGSAGGIAVAMLFENAE